MDSDGRSEIGDSGHEISNSDDLCGQQSVYIQLSSLIEAINSADQGGYVDPSTDAWLPNQYSIDPTSPDSPYYRPGTSN